MRMLILILLFSCCARAQMTGVVIGPFAGYGRIAAEASVTNNLRIPLLYYVPAELISYMPGGTRSKEVPPFRCMLVIDAHGCGEKSVSFSSFSAITTGDLPRLYNNGMPQYLRYSTSDYVGKKYAAPGTTDSFAVIYIFPQSFGAVTSDPCAGNTGLALFYPTYPKNILNWAKPFFGQIWDTTRTYLSGLSFGGGMVWLALQDQSLADQLAAVQVAAGGYIDERNITSGNTARGNGSNWTPMQTWTGGIVAIHSTDDSQTQPNGASLTDWAIDTLIKMHSPCTFQYIRRTTGDHAGAWTCWQAVANRFTAYSESNTQTYTFNIPWQANLLRWTTSGRKP